MWMATVRFIQFGTFKAEKGNNAQKIYRGIIIKIKRRLLMQKKKADSEGATLCVSNQKWKPWLNVMDLLPVHESSEIDNFLMFISLINVYEYGKWSPIVEKSIDELLPNA